MIEELALPQSMNHGFDGLGERLNNWYNSHVNTTSLNGTAKGVKMQVSGNQQVDLAFLDGNYKIQYPFGTEVVATAGKVSCT